MNNDYLLGSSAAIALLVSLNSFADLPNGVASGDVTQSSAVLWTRSDSIGKLSFIYSKNSDFSTIAGTIDSSVSDPVLPIKVALNGLEADTQYFYRATDSSGASAVGKFSTFATLGSKKGLRFGVSGDWRGELAPYPALSNVASKNLDFFAVLGDTIYADVSTPDLPQPQALSVEDFRKKHNEVYTAHYGMNTLADLRASTSIFVTMDDHEVTNDFAGAADVSTDERFSGEISGTLINNSVLFHNGVQVFSEYNPISDETYANTGQDPRTDGRVKLYRQRILGSDAVYFSLDARSFRDPELKGVANPLDQTEVGKYLISSLTADRTMLGKRQLKDLKGDLLNAQAQGIVWKFIGIPEPIQNLGVIAASDRFEGFAKERTELLKFIQDYGIDNVVFITADIHGTLVNNLNYQELTAEGIKQVATSTFEISTGSVAYDKAFGASSLEIASKIPVTSSSTLLDVFLQGVGVPDLATFELLPSALKDEALTGLVNQQLTPLGYTLVGLEDSTLDVSLLQGGYAALHTFGWTEFEVDANSQHLKVTTYGVDTYSEADIETNIANVLAREPRIINQFVVKPIITTVAVQCANFNHQQLNIPCINVADQQFSAQLATKQRDKLQFTLEKLELLEQPQLACATYHVKTQQIELPCVNVDNQQYWANLNFIQSPPFVFELGDFGLGAIVK
ncbi:MAG: alkaline phosphatase D family protein [Methylococcaceae bacterium]|nr:alkaline phosphatase D family protein [Methylococcaceae bacterium]